VKKSLVLIAVLLFTLACSGKKEERTLAPYFSLKDLSGKKITMDQFKGKPFLLVFWATWCPTCRSEIPFLNELAQEGHTVVAIALDRDREKLAQFAKEHRIKYTILMGSYQVTIDYGNVRFLPTIFLVDAQGYIVGRMVGGLDKKKVEAFLKRG